MPDTKENRFALAILAGFAIARLLFAFAIGLGIDESYTVAISRRLSLSYFDHPPLHLWIAHLAALALGENMAVRVVFVCLFFATGWIYYQFVSRLFGPRPALIALFALNVTPFFFASAGGWIVPDGPLLFGLAVAAWAASRLFFRQPLEEASAWQFWPLVGLGLGLAGLSKYSAILTASGLVTFLVLAPEQRHWLKHPALYVSAIFACAMITPVVMWNAQHGWASFEFQGGRGVPNGVLRPAQSLTMVLGEVAFLSPWIFAPLVAGIVSAFRHWRDERRLFLLCLSLPADRSFQPDAALGRARTASLGNARVVFCIPIDGRVGRRTRRLHAHASPRGFPFVGSACRDRRSRGCPSHDWLAVGDLDCTVPSCRSDARGIRMARSGEGANLR